MRIICDCFRCKGKVVDYRTAQRHENSTQNRLREVLCKLCTPHHSIPRHEYYTYHRPEILGNQDLNTSSVNSSRLSHQNNNDIPMLDLDDLSSTYSSCHQSDISKSANLSQVHSEKTSDEEEGTFGEGEETFDEDEETSDSVSDSTESSKIDETETSEDLNCDTIPLCTNLFC